jgi:hypothetical protein
LCEHNERQFLRQRYGLYARRIRFAVNSANFIPRFPHRTEATIRVWTYTWRRRRNGRPKWAADTHPGDPHWPAGPHGYRALVRRFTRTLAVAQPPTTITHPHLDQRHHLHGHHPHKPGPPISTEHKPPDNTPPDTTNLPSTTQAAPANNAPALNDTDIARAGRNPAPTLASGFPLALNCYL